MNKSPFISVYMPIAGWKAIMYTWSHEYGGFWEPEQTASIAFIKKEDAIQNAKDWAECEGLEYRDTYPNDTQDAPDKSVGDQLREILGDDLVVVELTGKAGENVKAIEVANLEGESNE